MPSIFRERAIAAQSGSDALSARSRVVPVRGWLALGLALLVLAGGALWLFAGTIVVIADGPGTIVNAPANAVVTAPVSGTLASMEVTVGSTVSKGQTIAVIAAPDGTTKPVRSVIAGVVVTLGPGPGATVDVGELLAVVAPDSDSQVAYAFVPAADAKGLTPGAPGWLLPEGADQTEVGYIRGQVVAVSPLPVPVSRIAYVLTDQVMAEKIAAQGPVVEVLITLDADASTPTGLAWTQPPGALEPIVSGTPAQASLEVAEVPPYRAFFDG